MMAPLTLSKPAPDQPALNFALLRAEGLGYLERLTHRLWNDFNIHDPGITILEALCYALTELGYRANFPIQDLLARPDRPDAAPSPLFPAETILPCRPVSILDWRKLLVDLNGVQNAWLLPAEVTYYLACRRSRVLAAPPADATPHRTLALKGLYDVLLEVDETIDSADPEALAPIYEAVRQQLHRHRNLCEDFVHIGVVPRKEFKLCAEIELAPEADADLIEAQILLAVQDHLTPPIRFYSLEEMTARGKTRSQIFEGPLLSKGFVDREELQSSELKVEIRLSDIVRVVMQVPGVTAVGRILLLPVGQTALPEDADKWRIAVRAAGEGPVQPILSPADTNLAFFKDRVPCFTRHAAVQALLAELRAAQASTRRPAAGPGTMVPRGRLRDLSGYEPLQNHFPATYGIGEAGLPASASAERKARARQLRAYLLFFDQILTDFFAQLAHLPELFSLDDAVDRTYFTQTVQPLPDMAGIYKEGADIVATLQTLTEKPDQFRQRRNAFLDHLLARFAENFKSYAWTLNVLDRDHAPAEAIRAKLGFLRDYPEISSQRGGAFNYLRPDALWDTDNVSGLAKRLARLLGIRNYRCRTLSDVAPDIYEERDQDALREYRFRIVDETPETGPKILLSGTWKYLDHREAMDLMRTSLALAMNRDNYRLKETRDGRFHFVVVDADEDIVARRIEYFETQEERETAIQYLIALLNDKYCDEGFHIVEHILLRLPDDVLAAARAPDAEAEATAALLLPVCVRPDCADGEFIDPYSYRISVILPAWARRFEQIAFRRLVEQTIRLETPAHILPKICWVDAPQMGEFEQAYQRWLQVRYGRARGSKTRALQNLVSILSRLRSVYPEAELLPCGAEEIDRKPFLLNQTIMGTQR